VIQGGSLTYTIGVNKDAFQASQYGTLLVHGLPTGTTYSFPELSGNKVYKNNGLHIITSLIISTSANTPPGSHRFTVKLDFDDGRSCSDSAIIKIKETPCPSFNISINADPKQGKAPLEIQFKARVSEKGTSSDKELTGEYTYKWDFADGGTSDEKNPIHNEESTGVMLREGLWFLQVMKMSRSH
jgi:PKD repeat protein